MTEAVLSLNIPEKHQVVREYADAGHYTVIVETGIDDGYGASVALVDDFHTYAIDLSADNVAEAKLHGVHAIQGDSGKELTNLLRRIRVPAVFWLDAHTCHEAGDPDSSPLFAELDAILAWEHAASSTVLIDNLNLMDGREGWPTLADVREKVDDMWDREELADIMRLTPTDAA